MEDLKEGDVVVLKSWGLPMTITSIEDKMYFCEWFEAAENGEGMKKQADRISKKAVVKLSE